MSNVKQGILIYFMLSIRKTWIINIKVNSFEGLQHRLVNAQLAVFIMQITLKQ